MQLTIEDHEVFQEELQFGHPGVQLPHHESPLQEFLRSPDPELLDSNSSTTGVAGTMQATESSGVDRRETGQGTGHRDTDAHEIVDLLDRDRTQLDQLRELPQEEGTTVSEIRSSGTEWIGEEWRGVSSSASRCWS